MVGRSLAFWEFFHPVAQEHFPDQLGQYSPKQMYDGVNVVRPSLIRVEADEATYNLHIAIRFDLEKALIEGELPSPDLPAAWNQRYRDDLGIEPPGDGMGVLQDVHWSCRTVWLLSHLFTGQSVCGTLDAMRATRSGGSRPAV